MAFTSATLGYGGVLQAFISSAYSSVVAVKSFTLPKVAVTVIDTTVLLSAQHTKEKIGGFIDPGEITGEAVWNPTTYGVLFGLTGLFGIWRIVLSNGSKFDFSGFLKALDGVNPLDAEVTYNFGIEISGPITFTP